MLPPRYKLARYPQIGSFKFASILLASAALLTPWGGERTLASSSPQSQQAVRVSTLGQESVQGMLVAITPAEVTLSVAGVDRVIPASEIDNILFDGDSESSKLPYPHLVTADNSVLFAAGIEGEGKDWSIPAGGWTLGGPMATSQMRILRIKELTSEQEASLIELLDEEEQSDTVIAVRPNGELTRIAGTILALKDSKVHFEFDGQTLEMPIERLAGLTWYQSNPLRASQGVEIVALDGSIWNASQLELRDSELGVETHSKMTVKLPLTAIAEIRMGTANVKWVKGVDKIDAQSDFEAAQKGNSPAWKFAEPMSAKAFTPRFVSTDAGEGSPTSAQFNLLFTKPGFYEFRMPEGFHALESVVVRSDQGNVRSEVVIEIWEDTERVLQETLPADQSSRSIKAKLTPGKRVRLTILSPSNSAVGTEVLWKQPKLLK